MANSTRPIPGKEDYYITELDVFHELHCLVSRRSYFQRRTTIQFLIERATPFRT